jgi:hypothetical protein
MKRIWIVALVLMLIGFSFAMAQQIHWANQITVTWDPPLTLVDGTPIPAEDIIAYNLYLRDYDEATMTPIPGTEAFVETTSLIQFTYTLNEGVWDPGVSAIRYIGGTGQPIESVIIWGSEQPSPFLLGYGRAPGVPGAFRVISP